MAREKMEWPRLAMFDEAEPIFGLFKQTESSPILMVKPGNPPVYFGTVENLQVFCRVFGLDYPRDLG